MQRGHFVWHDLYASDPTASKAFYAELLGWSVQDQDMGNGPYSVISANTSQIGGINALQPNMPASSWVSYIAVDDIAAALSTIESAGGTVDVPAFAVPGIGSMAFARDPWGAVFALFQDENPANDYALPNGNPAGGAAAWHELVTPDENGAIAFYASLTGWTPVAWEMEGFTYNGMTFGEVPMAGIFQAQAGQTTAWTIYFETNGSLTDAIAAVPALGGTLIGERVSVPGTGEFQIAADPSGAVFGLLASEAMS